MYPEIADKIKGALDPLLEEMRLVLVDISVRRQSQDLYIEIIADRPRGGITIEECSVLNRRLNDRMDQENLIVDNYFVEVSSPGLDRPLSTKEDFMRVLGRDVHFYLSETVQGRLEHVGVVKDAQEGKVLILVNGQDVAIPIEKIKKAVQVI